MPRTSFNCLLSTLAISFLIQISSELVHSEEAPINYPVLKEGHWEIIASLGDLPGGDKSESAKKAMAMLQNLKSTYCIDKTTQERMIMQSQKDTNCEKPTLSQNGNLYTADIVCNLNGVRSNSHVETLFTSDSSYSGTITLKNTGFNSTMKFEARHIGSCPAGMKPGDAKIIGPNGQNFNVSGGR